MGYVVDLLALDGLVGDCIPDFYPTLDSAIAAGFAVLIHDKEEREQGLADQFGGWAYGFEVRDPNDKMVYRFAA